MITKQRRHFTISRTFDAPRELVFDSWTDPDHLQWWLGPYRRPAPDPDLIIDLRPGGRFQVRVITDEEGNSHISGGVYREIARPEKLIFTWGFPADDPASSPLVSVRLDDLGGDRTEMIFHLHLPATIPDAQAEQWLSVGIEPGWAMTIDRLVEQLAAPNQMQER